MKSSELLGARMTELCTQGVDRSQSNFVRAVSFAVLMFVGYVSTSAQAQVCPSPAVVVDATCVVPAGTTITVTPANAIGLSASGVSGQITASGINLNLGAVTTTGGLAQSGAAIIFDGSTLATSATTTATSNGQVGLRAVGSGSSISGSGSTIRVGPSNGATASNLRGAIAESGAHIALTNTFLQMLGGTNGAANYGLHATGTGSQISFLGGSISTLSRGSFGVLAESGGTVTLGNGAQVTTTGVQIVGPPIVGSHALFATGAGSHIIGADISLSVSGLAASAARADNTGAVSLTNSSIVSTSTSSSDADPSSAVRVLSGGMLDLTGSSVTASGQRGHGFSVQDLGSSISITSSTLSASGTRANAGFIFGGGQAVILDSSLFSANSTAMAVQDAGSNLSLTNTNVRSTGAVGYGVRATAGGAATITGGAVTTEGRDGPALYAANSSIVASNVMLRTSGSDNAMGVLADLGGSIVLSGGAVETTGDSVRLSAYPHGLAARNPNGSLSATDTTVITRGLIAMGVVADDGGSVSLNNNTIRTFGTSSIGMYATVEQAGSQFPATISANKATVETFGAGAHGAVSVRHFLVAPSLITLTDSAFTTHGDGAAGLRAITAGAVNASMSTVLTQGTASHGIHARDNGSAIQLTDVRVSALGAASHGAVAEGGGLVIGERSSIAANGAQASALYAAGAPGEVSVARFTGSTLTNVSGPTIAVGGVANVTLNNSTASGSGEWLRVGTIADFPPLATRDAGLPGVTDPEGLETPIVFAPPAALPVVPGLANVVLSRSTVIGSAFTAPGSVSNVSLLDDSRWIMTGSSNVTNLLNDPSLIQFTPPSGDPTLLGSYKTLTTVNYIGEGGAIGLNTYLGTDGSPSDRLVIDGGTATGNSFLRIANTTGAGAVTTGNGILVVDAINGATTVPAAFALGGPVVAGPYEYTLHRSSVDASNSQAWYLRSTIDCSVAGAPVPPCPSPNPPTPIPNYRAETSLYAALPAMVLGYGRNLIDTLHERVGEERPGVAPGGGRGLEPSLGWARFIGLRGQREGSPVGVYGDGPKYGYDIVAFQGGLDLYRAERNDGGRDHAGIYGAVGQITADVTHVDGIVVGKDTINAYTAGAYWTRFSSSGWYFDALAQYTWNDATAASRRLPKLKTDGSSVALSLESGLPFALGAGWQFEPQAQLIYQKAWLENATEIATVVRFSNAESLAGRIGARIARSWIIDGSMSDGPRKMTAWFRPNLWYEFFGDPKTEFSSVAGYIPFRANLRGAWLEANVGVDAQIMKDISLVANAGYQWGLDGRSYAYNGKVGFRINW